MRMKRKRLKAAMLSIAVAAGMLLPCAASAQSMFGSGSGSSGSDGFFKSGGSQNRDASATSGNEFYGIEGYAGYSSSNEAYNTTDAPLGSGLVLLTALGAGYALLHRRRDKKPANEAN